MARWLSPLAALLLAVPAFAQSGDGALPGVGSEAPSFALPTYNPEASGSARAGTMLLVGEDSDDPATRVILVSFMASYCKPCRKELPVLERMHRQHKGRGLRVIGVSIDSEPEGQKAMGKLLEEAKVTFPVARDGFNLTARRYLGDKVPLPSVFVIDRSGEILFVSRGYDEEISRALGAAVEKALAGEAAAADAR
jgi:peroxiredoxin